MRRLHHRNHELGDSFTATTKKVAFLGIATVLLVGCGASTAGAPKRTRQAPPPHAEHASIPTVKFGVERLLLSHAAELVALDDHLFTQRGLKVQTVNVGNASNGSVALRAGEIQFLMTDAASLATSSSGGAKELGVVAVTNALTLNLTVSKAFAKRRHLSRTMPLMQRIKALKGAIFGVTAPGSPSDVFTRYLLRLGNLVPGKNVRVVSFGGGIAALLAAMQHGEIDGFLASPPGGNLAVADGYGVLLVSFPQGDVPGIRKFAFTNVATLASYASAHPAIVRKFAQAVAAGDTLIRTNPKEAARVLSPQFKSVSPSILRSSIQNLAPAFASHGLFTQGSWATALRVERQSGLLKGRISPKAGGLWTNRYVTKG